MPLNNPSGIAVNPVQPLNVSLNQPVLSAPLAAPLTTSSNKSDGIVVSDVHPSNAYSNILDAVPDVVILSNKPAGIAANDEQFLNVLANIYGIPLIISPLNSSSGTAANDVQPLNVSRNTPPVLVLESRVQFDELAITSSNKPTGIVVNDVHPVNVPSNILSAAPLAVISSNNPLGTAVNEVQLANVYSNIPTPNEWTSLNKSDGIVVSPAPSNV